VRSGSSEVPGAPSAGGTQAADPVEGGDHPAFGARSPGLRQTPGIGLGHELALVVRDIERERVHVGCLLSAAPGLLM
jgi:hypothetical protein